MVHFWGEGIICLVLVFISKEACSAKRYFEPWTGGLVVKKGLAWYSPELEYFVLFLRVGLHLTGLSSTMCQATLKEITVFSGLDWDPCPLPQGSTQHFLWTRVHRTTLWISCKGSSSQYALAQQSASINFTACSEIRQKKTPKKTNKQKKQKNQLFNPQYSTC